MSNFNREPAPPSGDSDQAIFFRTLLKWIKQFQLRSVSGARKITDANGGYHLIVDIPKLIQPIGFPWQKPNKELDPSVAVSKDTFVYITQGNPLVATGLVDSVTGELVKVSPGIWQAAQDVPAATGTGYNVPQVLTSGAVSGTPLKGDADAATVFWIPWAGVMMCG